MGDSLRSSLSSLGLRKDDPPLTVVPPTAARAPEINDLIEVLRRSVAEGTQPPGAILQAATDAARILAGADGVALALRTKGLVVCRTRSGDPTPEIGVPLNTESGISGECLRTASILVCHDTDDDSRVDPEVCREMGIRSIVVVPLRGPAGMAGILEAFSTRTKAFGEDQINLLRALSEIAEAAYARECETVKAAAFSSLRAAKNRIASSVGAGSEPVPEKLGFAEMSPARRYWILGAAVAAVLLVVGVWLSGREPSPEAAASTQPAAQTQKLAPQVQVQAETIPLAKPKPGTSRSNAGHEGSSEGLKNAAEITIETVSESRPTQLAAVRAPDNPATMKSGTAADPAEPPPIAIESSKPSDQLASLTTPSNTMPTLAARVSQGLSGGELIQKTDPTYPALARAQRLAGTVTLEFTIAEDGSVKSVKQIDGPGILASAATEAIRKWKYRPFLLNGSPVAVQKQITVLFKLP